MQSAAALRIEHDPSTTDLVAKRRREALTMQLSRKALPPEELIADALEIDDQLSVLRDRLDSADRTALVNDAYIVSLHDRSRAINKKHAVLADKVVSIEARTHQAFARADAVMDGHSADIAQLIETRNAHSLQIDDLTKEQRALELAVGERVIVSQIDHDMLARHGAEMAEFRQRLEAIEAVRTRQPQEQPKEDGLPLSAHVVLWAVAFAAVGAAIYSFIA